MAIARLDNEVFFKKAFTDELVFKAFVHDIVGIDILPDKIETEKSFSPRLGNINFKYDIFAEDSTNRVIVEIQKVEYDHNFDRFLHYHNQAISEQQRGSDDYTVGKTVYTIVVLTAPYKKDKNTGNLCKDEVLISKSNPNNLQGIERKIFNHEMILLNPNYKGESTPGNYRDWLDLIYESIHHPDQPEINLGNLGIKRASELVNTTNIDPFEWEASKFAASKKKVIEVEREEGIEEGVEKNKMETASIAIKAGFDNATIMMLTSLTEIQINQLRAELRN